MVLGNWIDYIAWIFVPDSGFVVEFGLFLFLSNFFSLNLLVIFFLH